MGDTPEESTACEDGTGPEVGPAARTALLAEAIRRKNNHPPGDLELGEASQTSQAPPTIKNSKTAYTLDDLFSPPVSSETPEPVGVDGSAPEKPLKGAEKGLPDPVGDA